MNYLLDTRSVTPHFPGIGRYVRNLARCLPDLLANDESLTLLLDTNHPPLWLREEIRENVTFTASNASPFSLAQQWQIPRQLRTSQTDLYHSPYYLMPYRLGAPTVLTVYDVIAMRYPQTVSARARLLFRLSTILALRTASAVIAISQATRRDFIETFRVAAEKISAIPLAAECLFRPQPVNEIKRICQQYHLDQPFALYLGINKPHKNLPRLVEAWMRIKPAGWQLAIGGAWDARYPQARQLAASCETIRFLGSIPESNLPALYAAASLFIFPSFYEGFGLPVLEAMACGTPVACSNASSLPEVGGQAVLYFNPLEVDSIKEALKQAISDEALRQNLTEKGLVQASQFSWQQMAQATLAVYRGCLK